MNDQQGLPEIADISAKRKPIVIMLMALILGALFSFYYFAKKEKGESKGQEETYTIDASNIEEKIILPNGKPIISEEPEAINQTKSELTEAEVTLIQEKQRELQQRLAAPLMIVNQPVSTNDGEKEANANQQLSDPNTQFMQQMRATQTASINAQSVGSLNHTILEGTLIHGVLESATNSDLPGYVRAIVSQPVYAENGSQILVPSGSRLIGQYKSGMLQGQSRIFIVWTRLIASAGISVALGSPGVDSLGVAGIGADEIDRHFWQRFGTASLLSLLSAGAANVGVNSDTQENSASEYRAAIANSFAQSANQSLQNEAMIAPTLKTYQGKPIIVFVAKDIHFKEVLKAAKPNFYLL